MKFAKKDILVLSVNLTTSQKSQKTYCIINFVDGDDGSQYSVSTQDLQISQKVHGMEKWKVDLNLTSTAKFGARLEVTNWIEKIG